MTKITTSFAILSISVFLSFSSSAFAVQDFDYYFGTLLVSTQKVVDPVSPALVSAGIVNNPNLAQISSMQANLNQIKSTLANLNSSLAKSNFNSENQAVKDFSGVTIAKRIPLLLSEKTKKEEKNTPSIFASLIPPDVRNSPLIATHLVILTLGFFGIIMYLFFIKHREKKQEKRLSKVS